MHDTIGFLEDLIGIDSVNPSLVPGGAGEQGVAERIGAELRAAGLAVEMGDVAPGRPNVIGVLDSGRAGPTLLLCGHTDTVGVAGMHAPFAPVQRDGRLYGRGAQDMKGGLAAMVGAAVAVAATGLASGRLVVAAVADEEYASLGADALAASWRADAAVVTEPTDLQIAVGHKGFSWIDVATAGRAAHGSRPADGRDAILDMGRVLTRLAQLDAGLQARPPHPRLGTPSLHASTIAGGRELSVYPDQCALTLERRTLVGEPDGTALAEVRELLARLGDDDAGFTATARLRFERPAYEIAPDAPLPRALARALAAHGVTPAFVGMSFWTDAAILGRAGIPSVLFGPSGAGLHGVDEYVAIDSVLACRDVLVRFARAYGDQPPNVR